MYNSPYSSSAYSSNYGSGMPGYGYGAMNSYSSMRPAYGANNLNPQNAQNPQQQQNQPPNERRQFFQQYFKMMGGARSILEMGFGGIFLATTAKQTYDLLKKIIVFLLSTSKKFANFLFNNIPLTNQAAALYKKFMMESPNSQNNGTTINRIMLGLRIISFFCLILCVKVKHNVKKQIQKQHVELVEKYEHILKQKQQQLQKIHEHHYQKEGYF